MNALMLALAVPGILASASQYDPPPEDLWLGLLWVAASLCVVFALCVLADFVRERTKKSRRGKWRVVKTKPSNILGASDKSAWSSDEDGGSTV